MKGPNVPEMARCAGCRRNLLVREYSGFPGGDVPDERVSWTIVGPGFPTYEMLCTCGHYTVVSRFPRRRSDEGRGLV
jgi:hypothetical protein